MATQIVDVSSSAISSESTDYRRYVSFGTVTESDGTSKTTLKEARIMAETTAKDKDSGISQNWKRAEADGLSLFNENKVISYSANSQEGFELLIPDETQRLYIINAGLSQVQTAKAQAFMKSMLPTEEPTPEFNQVTLDLRVGLGEDGEYSIQTKPQRSKLTEREMIFRTMRKLGIPEEQIEAIVAVTLAAIVAQKAE